ncbi:MAG TPA: hypothetical protein VF081_08495 [Solirubrobacterales bacterium]
MNQRRIAALLAAAAFALFLTACGGGSDDGDSSSATSAPAEETSGSEPTSSGAGLTPPGTTLKLGTEATVSWVPPSKATLEATEGDELKVTVESIEEGSIEDFDGIGLEADDEDNIPYYVNFRLEAVGDVPGTSTSNDPDFEFTAFDADDEQQVPTAIIGEFEPCSDEPVPVPFKAGESYESCRIYLLPEGIAIESIKWDNGPNEADELSPYYEDPIVWEGS